MSVQDCLGVFRIVIVLFGSCRSCFVLLFPVAPFLVPVVPVAPFWFRRRWGRLPLLECCCNCSGIATFWQVAKSQTPFNNASKRPTSSVIIFIMLLCAAIPTSGPSTQGLFGQDINTDIRLQSEGVAPSKEHRSCPQVEWSSHFVCCLQDSL